MTERISLGADQMDEMITLLPVLSLHWTDQFAPAFLLPCVACPATHTLSFVPDRSFNPLQIVG